MFGAARRLHLALDRVRRERAAREPREQAPRPRGPDRRRAARSSPPTASPRSPARSASRAGSTCATTRSARCSRSPIGYYDPYNGSTRARALPQRGARRARRAQQSSILDQLEGKLDERRRGRHDARRARAAGRLRRRSPAATARSSRSCPSTGAIRVLASSPSYDPNAGQEPRRVRAAAAATRPTRCSTTRPRRSTRPARRSRS